jgi:hypothetical protein
LPKQLLLVEYGGLFISAVYLWKEEELSGICDRKEVGNLRNLAEVTIFRATVILGQGRII